MSDISEKSRITIGLLVVIIGGVVWLSTLHANTSENTKQIAAIAKKEEQKDQVLVDILIRLAKIEGMLTRKDQR